MVISQTPLRMSFFGGGTDFKDYYEKYGGVVISASINKYIYFMVNSRNDSKIALSYSKHEIVNDVNKIQHDIFREVLKLLNITSSIEIVSVSDITSEGSGLGSSSAFTVGLLNALFAYKNIKKTSQELAELACKIEINILGNPIGKQDQYAVAYGGVNKFYFDKDDSVKVNKIKISNEQLEDLNNNILVVNTGITRRSSMILNEQKTEMPANIEHLHMIKNIAESSEIYLQELNYQKLGELLNTSWEQKRMLANKISNQEINAIYELGKKMGIYGGKLLGAGGGGFFLFLCPKRQQKSIKDKLINKYQILPVEFTETGSRIIFKEN